MRQRFQNAEVVLAMVLLTCTALHGQTTPVQNPTPTPTPAPSSTQPSGQNTTGIAAGPAKRPGTADSNGTVHAHGMESTAPSIPTAPGVLVDQVIAMVNGDLVLESDVEEERKFEGFVPFSAPGSFDRDKAVERLIDRNLILQQAKLQPDQLVTRDEAEKQLQSLRTDLPACKAYRCETDEGWQKFVKDHGFTMDELVKRWQQRMDILKFIEMRFRSGIDITPEQIKSYYEKTMLPEYAKVNATPPKLAVISDRIQEVLLEQQVSALLSDWLKSLKAQGTVQVLRPGEVQP